MNYYVSKLNWLKIFISYYSRKLNQFFNLAMGQDEMIGTIRFNQDLERRTGELRLQRAPEATK